MNQKVFTFLLVLIPSLVFSQVRSTSSKDNAKSKDTLSFVEEMPKFPGGEAAMSEFIVQQFKVSDSARKSSLEIARLIVRFIVTETGAVADVKTLSKIGFGLEEEAIRVVRSFPKWIPGQQNGIPVPVLFTLPITIAIDSSPSDQKK